MSVSRYLTIDGLNCLDPGRLIEHAEANGTQTEFWGRANSITSGIGPEPGVAWILVPRLTYDELEDTTDQTHTIRWFDDSTTTTFAEWVIVSATAQAADGDSKAPYLVELRDARHRLKNSGLITARYNVSEAMPAGTDADWRRNDTTTLNGGSEWTWQQMFDAVWAGLPSGAAGAAPTLPWTPSHNPRSWRFDQVSAYDAINQILAACQSALTCNPLTGAMGVVALGTAQAGIAAAQVALRSKLILDWQPLTDTPRADLPATIRVVFRSRHRSPNTIEQLDMSHKSAEYNDEATGFVGVEASRVRPVHTDLFAEMDDNNARLNTTDLNTTSAAIAARCVLRYDVSGNAARAEYSGITTTILPGTQIHQVRWRDYGDDDGTRTEWLGIAEWGEPSEFVPPLRPKTARMAIVELTQDLWSQSNGWAKMESCRVVRYFLSTNTYQDNYSNEQLITVWHPTGYPDNSRGGVRTLHAATGLWPCKHGKNDWAWVAYDDVSERWEILSTYEDHWRFELKDDLTDRTAQAYLVLWDGAAWTTQTLEFTVWDSMNLHPGLKAGHRGFSKYFGDSQKWEILTSVTGRLIRFKLTTQLSLGGQATAIEIGTGNTYTEIGDPFTIKDPWDNPGAWREDIHSTKRSSPGGYRGWCIIPPDAELDGGGDPIREIVWMEQLAEHINFTLVTDMSAGQAEITIDKYYGQSGADKDPNDVWPTGVLTKYVHDPQGLYPRALATCKGKARYNLRDHRYEIVTCDQQITSLKFTLGADMCAASNAVISGANRISWPTFGKMPSPAPTTATNPYGLSGKSGDPARAYFNDSSGEWEVDQVLHVEKTVGVEFAHYFVSDCGALRLRKQTVSVMRCADTYDDDEVALYAEDVLVDSLGGGIDDNTADSGSGASQCVVDITWSTKTICTIQTNPAQTAANGTHELFQATPRDAVENVYVDGLAIKKSIGVHYVICFEAPAVSTVIDLTTECPP